MSKLDDVLNDDLEKIKLKILILEVFADALHDADSFADVAEKFREKVSAL